MLAAATAYAADPASGGAPLSAYLYAANVAFWGGQGVSGDVGFDSLGLEAHAGKVTDGFGIQGDFWIGRVSYNVSGGPAYNTGLGVHLNKQTDHGLVGGLVSVGLSPGGYNDTFINAALEAQHDFGQVTIGGQAGYTAAITRKNASHFSLLSPDGWYGHAIGRWFATDDFMLAGDVGYGVFADTTGTTGNFFRWGARLEYKLEAAPVSFFVNYRGYTWTQTTFTGGAHAGLVGVTFIAGDQTLAARYRGAAGLDDRNPFYGVDFPQ